MRSSHFGVARAASVAARFTAPGTTITSPRRQPRTPWSATSAASPTTARGSFESTGFASAAPLSISVAVMPGQSAVIVTPLSRSSSASDSVSEST